MIGGEHFTGATHAALNLIDDQNDAMLIADTTKALQKSSRRRDVTAFALHRFNDDCGDFLGRRGSGEQAILDPIQSALSGAALATVFLTKWIAIFVRIRDVDDIQCLPLKSQTLRDFRRCQRQRSQRAAMKTIKKRDEFFASRGMHC